MSFVENDKKKSDLILDEVKKRRTKEKIVNIEEEKIKLVIFTLSNDYYTFQSKDVKEILPVGKITYLPGSPDYILGIINVRGDIESVLDIHKFIGLLRGEITTNSRIIIAAKGDIHSGILVDSVVDVLDVPKSSIQPPLSTLNKSLREFVAGETTYQGKSTIFLDVGKIFSKIIA